MDSCYKTKIQNISTKKKPVIKVIFKKNMSLRIRAQILQLRGLKKLLRGHKRD